MSACCAGEAPGAVNPAVGSPAKWIIAKTAVMTVNATARLEGEGWPRVSVNLTPDGEWAGALYHLGTCGLRVEMVDIARSGPRLCRYLAGGDYT